MLPEIQEIIRKSLPEEVGTMLRSELAELARLRTEKTKWKEKEEEEVALRSELATSKANVFDLQRKVERLEEKAEEVKKMEENARADLTQINLTIADIKRQSAEKSLNDILRLVEKVFGHPQVSVSTHRSESGSPGYATTNVNEMTTQSKM